LQNPLVFVINYYGYHAIRKTHFIRTARKYVSTRGFLSVYRKAREGPDFSNAPLDISLPVVYVSETSIVDYQICFGFATPCEYHMSEVI
jgi:hypothetical protein